MGENQKQDESSESTSSNPMGWMNSKSIIPGLTLILLGSIFLLGNLTGFRINNWWALFILIPAFGSISSGWARYRKVGRFDRSARSQIFSSLFLIFLSAVFLLGLDFSQIWPVFVILAGLGILVGANR